MIHLRNNKRRIAILASVIFLLPLLLFGGSLYFHREADSLNQKGMGDLILDTEADAGDKSSSGQTGKANPSGSQQQAAGTSWQNTSENNAENSSAPGQDNATSEGGTSSDTEDPSGDSGQQESTNRHPYELPLIPVDK